MTTPPESWIVAKPGQLRLVLQHCPELARPVREAMCAADAPIAQEIPLWLSALLQAWQGALVLGPRQSFPDVLAVVRGNLERQQALATMARLGVVSASDALELIEQWESEGDAT